MLDPWIIEEIRRREQEERRKREEQERPVLEIPAHPETGYPDRREHDDREEENEPRGVVIVDFRV
jgi:hypothetical protein